MPIIVDADLAVDDYLAILYLLSRPDVNVLAITISSTGETHCKPGLRNTQAVLESLERTDIPIACGREEPPKPNQVFPQEWRDGVDNFFGISLPLPQPVTPTESAPELIQRLLNTSSDKTTIIMLGPMTNLSDALDLDASLAGKFEMVYSMGGAVNVPGNVMENPVAEWNYYVDPVSAHRVLNRGVPLTLVPLDATNHVPVTTDALNRLAGTAATPAAKLAHRLLQTQSAEIQRGTLSFWDTLTSVLVTNPETGSFREMNLTIDTESGRTVQDSAGSPLRVATGADAGRFLSIFLQTLNGQFE